MNGSDRSSEEENFDTKLKDDDSATDNYEKSESKDELDEELEFSSKAKEIIDEDSKRKFPILSIIAIAIGIVIIIIGITTFLSISDRIADNVIFGEGAVTGVFAIFVGVLFLGIGILSIISTDSIFGNTFDKIKDLELLDEEDFIEKEKISEEERSNQDYNDSELDIIEESNGDMEDLKLSHDSDKILLDEEEYIDSEDKMNENNEVISSKLNDTKQTFLNTNSKIKDDNTPKNSDNNDIAELDDLKKSNESNIFDKILEKKSKILKKESKEKKQQQKTLFD
ncbi:hypothetical protein MBCUT_13440 [Methanobrevibacter cuticularis]|uniref:Uncharacterized protein n=1 Tax=Methanobrevibacter cuticularis TaxID=47311 RepID=A0A166DKP4_9EURY|nr:hypothetical protein [Methanobrevibacter cuticularis]KZX15694.1 hypothetical protein MBCUT_13440 [Methanobrevibacter cuticularis]